VILAVRDDVMWEIGSDEDLKSHHQMLPTQRVGQA
jgi:hypothetical protein